MASLVLTIKTNKDVSLFKQASQDQENLNRIINLISGVAIGAQSATVDIQSSSVDPARATGTVTLASCATDTVTIGKTVFTGTSTPTTALHFETDGSDTADAAALAAAINAHTDAGKIVTATSALGVVTITANQAGLIGNHIALAETGNTITISASFLAGGTGGSSNAQVSITR